MKDFHHPFTPYDIQLEFMNALYDCIEDGQVGIFESPTGTGKSLSLICGSLTWLREQQVKLHVVLEVNDHDEEPAWVIAHKKEERLGLVRRRQQDLEGRLSKIRAKEHQQKQRYENGEPLQKRTKSNPSGHTITAADEEASYLLDDYDSEDETTKPQISAGSREVGGISTKSFDLLNRLGMIVNPISEADDMQALDEPKIFYCSRTHSQLTQFANEVRRVKSSFALQSMTVSEEPKSTIVESVAEMKYLSLGSRKNLCINPKVTRLASLPMINERCLELQQPGTPQDDRCPFIPNKEKETLVNDFRDHTLASIRDIEDMGELGKRIGVCPYYASRAGIKPSELITLPYPLLLQKTAREALDITLKGHVVIIDEAHNLMDAISNMYSVKIFLSQLERSRGQLGIYLQRFRNKLKGRNRVYITQLVRLVDSLIAYLKSTSAKSKSADGLVEINNLMAGKGVDQINLYKLVRYLQESKLARKVDGYDTHSKQSKDTTFKKPTSTMPVLTQVQSFLQTLVNPAVDGRYFVSSNEGSDLSLKYMLLDPTYHFKEIVEEARAVILAGGTMSPMEDYTHHLFPYLSSERIKILSCGHVIPVENLLALPITKGPTGLDFDFTFERRNTPGMIDALGTCVLRLSQTVPDGLVVFFPSYAYLEQVTIRWKAGLENQCSIWNDLAKNKAVFLESRDNVGVEDVLQDYTHAIQAGKGGLLLSVIGGKMSEGINFSDKLGRAVVVVGLPFPNIHTAEWKAKLEYIENATISRGGSAADGKMAGRQFYENACMRAVNQSIGRAIRHQNDYAAIIMLDRRYNTPRIQEKLPAWIQKSLLNKDGKKPFSEILSSITGFFDSKTV
ncbi:ATP-dependent DNA helicase chl1 [Xylographa pallens]|nr:ATP-dependent DNA helicase chl1 [Xylographa pallens]